MITCTVLTAGTVNWEALGAVGTVVTGVAAAWIAFLTYSSASERDEKQDKEREALARAAALYVFPAFLAYANRLALLQNLAKQAADIQSEKTAHSLAQGITELSGRGLPALEPVLQGMAAMPPELSAASLAVYTDNQEVIGAICRFPENLHGVAYQLASDPNAGKAIHTHAAQVERRLRAALAGAETAISKLRTAYNF